jgi:hypothetical protein
VGGGPSARTFQLGGRFPEGVRRQTQVASAARTAVQQVAADVVSVLVHPPQRTVGAGPGGGARPLSLHGSKPVLCSPGRGCGCGVWGAVVVVGGSGPQVAGPRSRASMCCSGLLGCCRRLRSCLPLARRL